MFHPVAGKSYLVVLWRTWSTEKVNAFRFVSRISTLCIFLELFLFLRLEASVIIPFKWARQNFYLGFHRIYPRQTFMFFSYFDAQHFINENDQIRNNKCISIAFALSGWDVSGNGRKYWALSTQHEAKSWFQHNNCTSYIHGVCSFVAQQMNQRNPYSSHGFQTGM